MFGFYFKMCYLGYVKMFALMFGILGRNVLLGVILLMLEILVEGVLSSKSWAPRVDS